MHISLHAEHVAKVFNRKIIFSDLSFAIEQGHSLAVTGHNGSGKSTLLKILCGALTPTAGKVEFRIGDRMINAEDRYTVLGFVAPYLQLYDEFTAWENLDFFRTLRRSATSDEQLALLLETFNLLHRKDDIVGTYSSGMKQRLKYVFALLHQPPFLLLDEPMSNLDRDGVSVVSRIITEQTQRGAVVIATNDPEDIQLCDAVLDLDSPSVKILS